MTIVFVIYAVLIIIFLVMSALILRHTVKFGYLSPRFKTIVTIFGLLAFGVFVFSIYLIIMFSRAEPSSSSPYPSVPSTTTVTPGDINF